MDARRGDFVAARGKSEASLSRWQALGDRHGEAAVYVNLGLTWPQAGDVDRARPLPEQGVALARQIDDHRTAAMALHNLAMVVAAQGEHDLAVSLSEDSLAIRRVLHDRPGIAAPLWPSDAATLFGAVRALRERTGIHLTAVEAEREERAMAAIADAISTDACRQAYARGRLGSIDDLYALTGRLTNEMRAPDSNMEGDTTVAAMPSGAGPEPAVSLSRRERDVLRRLALGMTNREIADELVLSVRTMEPMSSTCTPTLGPETAPKPQRMRSATVLCEVKNATLARR